MQRDDDDRGAEAEAEAPDALSGTGDVPARAAALGRVAISDDELERLLDNWARWCREHQRLGECNSIERKWRSPQVWHEPGAPVTPLGPIDRVSALEVNDAWRRMPEPYKSVLKDWYVHHRSPFYSCRRLSLRPRAHAEYLRIARLMCRNLLTTG